MQPIAHIRSDFPEKFGIPRASGLVPELRARIVFTPEFRRPEAVRGIEGFSHLWLIWLFSGNAEAGWSPTVRPPRLGGNERMGVFATRAPFRPNPIGLSAVELLGVDLGPEGPVLTIGGADLMDGTPILDIKPYVPIDSIPHARGGFITGNPRDPLEVDLPPELASLLPEHARAALPGILAADPRPAYQVEPGRTYSMSYAGCEVDFRVDGTSLTVTGIRPTGNGK
ncbi:MAG: tRNA (N6-threonylcarbamoyladenosine(37)-N6)-methyltransferase TrmO [bacterium]|nr:tRNA (N6-threonylcarbamoyladenosine(37)-N6)-methyltransferase TrmO [bacterium]